jgi:hypothetical protein
MLLIWCYGLTHKFSLPRVTGCLHSADREKTVSRHARKRYVSECACFYVPKGAKPRNFMGLKAKNYSTINTLHLARIIHQPEKSTREGPFGGQMILNTTVCQEHHDPKASSSDGLGSVRIGLSVAIRHTSAWQPPRADNHRFALELSDVSIALTGPATSDVHPLTTLNSASIPAPPGTTRAMQS